MASLWEDRALERTLDLMGSPRATQRPAARTVLGSLDDALPLAEGGA